MKLLFPALLVLLGCAGRPQTAREAAARLAFESLKKNDFGIYVPLCITVEDIERVIAQHKVDRSPSLTKGIQDILDDVKEREHYRDQLKDELQIHEGVWKATRDRVPKVLSWEKAEFHRVEPEKAGLGKGGWCNVTFLVESDGKVYRFLLNGCLKVGRGWICLSGLCYLGRK